MRHIIFLFITLVISSCNLNDPLRECDQNLKEMLANEISFKVAAQLKNANNLGLIGLSGGTMDHIRMLGLMFNYHKEIEIEEGRELLMKAGTLFLKTINEDKRVHPYLKNYPFLATNIEVKIFLNNKNGIEFGAEKLSVISLTDGILSYDIRSAQTKRLTTIHTETFEEAQLKLKTMSL